MDASAVERAGALLRKRWRWLLAAALVLALWALAGFLLVPRLARHTLENYVRHDLQRQISIGRISFNPFTLTAEVRDLALAEADGAPLISFALLRINAEAFGSLLHRAWTLKELRLEQPVINLRIDAAGRLNLAALAPPPRPGAAAAPPRGLPAVRIGALSVDAGSIAFQDRSRSRPFSATLTPIHFTLNDFRTTPAYENAYRFEAETLGHGKLAWSGRFTVQPLGSDGDFSIGALQLATVAAAVAYLRDAIPLALPSGRLDLQGRYRLRLDGAVALDVELPSIAVRELAIAPKAGDAGAAAWIRVPTLDLGGTTLSLTARRLHVDSVHIADADVTLWRDRQGFNLAHLLQPAPVGTAAAPGTSAPAAGSAAAPAPRPSPAWDVSVGSIVLKAASVDFEDRTLAPAGHLHLTPIDATLSDYALKPGSAFKLEASVGFDGHGRVSARGAVTPAPLAAELDVGLENLELPALQPWVAAAAALSVEQGSASAHGHLALRPAPQHGQSALQFKGDVTVARLLTRDAALRQDLIGWRQLDVRAIDLRQRPARLDIDTIRMRQPYARVVIGPDRTLNIARVLAGPAGTPFAPSAPADTATLGAEQAPAPAAAPTPAPVAGRAAARPRMPMSIRRVLIEDGTADFADLSVQPNFAAGILELAGSVTGLSSDPDSRATVALKGSVDRYAPVDVSGQVNLLAADVYSDIALNFRNMELTTFNPYSGKFAGYSIAKGKLTTELKYHVEHRRLDAQHHIVLDQLEFGAATASKDAVPLPIKLAVALLKDRNGVIDINLPVSGSLDDPHFRIGPIVWKAVLGLVRRIVTAPFALLGSLFGGGADLQYVQFAAGSAELGSAEQDKLGKLAKALSERPQLKLDIPLETLTAADAAALDAADFEAAVAAAAPQGRPPANPRLAALAALYAQTFGSKPVYPPPQPAALTAAGAAPPDPAAQQIAWLSAQLKPRYVVTPEQRAALARARADAVQAAVLAGGQVQPERVFLSERASGAGGAPDTVRMELKLR
jgi:hypothetical protein